LQNQNQHRQDAEKIQEIEIFGRVVLAQMLFVQLGQREAVIHPIECFFRQWGLGGNLFEFSHGFRL
jgi:hypothetical protein